MKRLVTLLGIVVLVGAIAIPALAHGPGWGRGHHMGPWGEGPGSGYCGAYGPGYSNLTEEQRAQLDMLNKKFNDETAQLRDQIWAKSRELNALLDSPTPDAEKARNLQKEISDLQAKMDEKRLNHELQTRRNAPDGSYDRGYGPGMRGYGRGMGYGHMGGYGPGMGWN